MLSETNRAIAKRLLEKAKAGKVAWDPAPDTGLAGLTALIGGVSTVSVTLREAKISISMEPGEKLRFSVFNADGVQISASYIYQTEEDYGIVHELYGLGWRQARKYDETMKEIEEYLASEDPQK